MNQLVFSFRILKKRRGNLLKNRKQRIVAGFIALLILLFCSSISFSAAKEPVATSAPVATVTVEVTPEPEPTPSPETKINYSDTIQVLVTPELKQKIEYLVSTYDNEIIMATKVMIAEAGGVYPLSHRAAVVWCILNRADATGNSISSIITAPNQFAWVSSQAYSQEQYDFVKDIFTRWLLEKEGFENVGRVLPEEYKWFRGDGSQNHFRNAYSGSYTIWDWSFPSPYDDE